MPIAKNRNLTVRLPTGLLRRLKEKAAADGVSMNSYLERVLDQALCGHQEKTRRAALERLLARMKDGLYTMDRPLTREKAHQRDA